MSLQTPQKLQRLRRVLYSKAKQESGCRFHFLYDKVSRMDVLTFAYAQSRSNGGAAGVDGQTFEDIEAHGVQRWLGEIHEELRGGRYSPKPVKRVMIPKAGGVGERPLGIPTVRDRVVQTAAKLVLEAIFEADFDDCAYGYRPRRSAEQAVRRVHEALWQNHSLVIDADLSKYFDNIPHAELMKSVARRVSDRRMLQLIKLWLKAPVEVQDERGNRHLEGGKKSTRGTPQGGVLTPPTQWNNFGFAGPIGRGPWSAPVAVWVGRWGNAVDDGGSVLLDFHPRDQGADELATLMPVQVVQAVADLCAELAEATNHRRELDGLFQVLLGLCKLVACASESCAEGRQLVGRIPGAHARFLGQRLSAGLSLRSRDQAPLPASRQDRGRRS